MTVSYLFQKVFTDTLLGYIKIMFVDDQRQGIERDVISLTALELFELFDKEAKEYYQVGTYWYIVL